jgi:pilus assembly protein CpaE
MTRNRQILLVDTDIEHRGVLKQMLSTLPYAVVGEANYGVEASRLAVELRPDIALIHVEEPLAITLRNLEIIEQASPDTIPVVISSRGDAETARKAMLAGARGFIVSPCNAQLLDGVLTTAFNRRRVGVTPGVVPLRAPVAGSIITVFGPKGGIGKTTLATNLAISLKKRTTSRVALVDLDAYFGDVSVIMGMEASKSIVDVLAETEGQDVLNVEPFLVEHRSGVAVLGARHPGDVADPPDPDAIARVLKSLARTFDFVVVDTPGVFGPQVAAALDESSTVLLVTSADIASIKDARYSLDTLRNAGFDSDRMKLVVNHATRANSVTDSDVARTVNYEVSWVLPHDEAVPVSTQHGDPLVLSKPGARMAKKVDALAAYLGGAGVVASPRKRSWYRLFRRAS